ncbi:serine hydrolase [Lactobacillus sp. LL6]|uniref:serine hydrolase n=1 Tax=Lactobacillus sp. LL6 TaxID=2596827 RepID=UPI0011848F63|nr:serine hydrolase [Lactobacillus sp. LL6]TSO26643.1 D-alanyl-D-alanine carboxypeptidase [Lactobacillus sp. LL6]
MSFHNKIKKTFITLTAAISLAGGGLFISQATTHVASAATYDANQLNLDVKSAIAIDSHTGQILYTKNKDKVLPIASMTKLITIYLTLNAIKNKKISWNTTVEPTDSIIKVANNSEYSNVPLKKGHKYTIKQLYQATLIESANGAAMCLAQAVSGNQENFVKLMRKQLKAWNINDAKIYTVCGLPNGSLGTDAYPGVSKNAENVMSAKSMAVVGQHLLRDYPEVLNTTKLAHLDFKDGQKTTKMDNFNWMLKGLSQYDANLDVDGLKTGTTDAAGACFIGTMQRKGARIITVVMGARHQDGTDPSRFVQTKKLMHYIFAKYTPVILKQGESIKGAENVMVKNGQEKTVPLGLRRQVTVWDPVDGKGLSANLKDNPLEAPVDKGTTIDSYEFKSGNEKLISLSDPTQMQIQAQAMKGTAKVNWFTQVWRWIIGEN